MSNSLVNSLNELYYGCKYMVFNICNGSNHIFDLTNNIQTEYVMIFGESNPTIFSDKLSYQLAFTELNLDPYLGAAFLFSTSSKLINGLSIENWLALYSNVIYAFIVELPADQSIEMVNGWDIKSLNKLGEFRRGKSKHRPRNDKVLFTNGTYHNDFGYAVELDTDDEGEPIIVGDSLGADFIANFDSCTENVGCTFVIFSFYWDAPQAITPAKLNEWNSTEWYGQAHNAEDGAVGVSFATTLEGGVHEDNITAMVTLWDEYVGYFEEFIGITGDPGGKTPPPAK